VPAPSLVLLLPLLLQAPAVPSSPERDLGDVVRAWLGRPAPAETDDERRRVILPTISASPAACVAAGLVLTSQARDPDTGILSLRTASASYSTKRRLQIIARVDEPVGARWRLLGDWRYYDFTERTYGLGSDTVPDTFVDAPLHWGRGHLTVYRRLVGALEVGAGYRLDVRQVHDLAGPNGELPARTVLASGISADAQLDLRDNAINATRGAWVRASLRWFPHDLGSERDWQAAELEARTYWQLPSSRRQVIALWGTAWTTFGGDPSYFDLPSTGWDFYGRSARGYAAGRYRGRSWIDGEVEYRVDAMTNGLLGIVVFANTSTLSDAEHTFGAWAPAAGFGLRLKLDKRHGSNLCVDYAWGNHGSRGLFLALNEAF
jgi:hypothetical protein